MIKVFLDANILFSAAMGGESFELLWQLAALQHVRLSTSRYCFVEAKENLRRKYPAKLDTFSERMQQVEVVSSDSESAIASDLLPDKDAPVLAAALSTGADVLLTGDLKHFGHLMSDGHLPISIRTVRDFLLSGPTGA